MMNLKFQYTIVFLLAFGLFNSNCTSHSVDKPPNVVFILADDLGYETIGANGGTSYQTPAIDQLASDGMRFEHCYAQPLCTPTRVQLMTGIYNVRNYVSFGLLEPSQTTFANLFREAGYATGMVGKWQLGKAPSSPNKAGFDNYCLWQLQKPRADSTGRDTRYAMPVLTVDGEVKTFAETDYGPEVINEYGLDFIEKSHQSGKPFFLYYSMMLTHCPFSPTPHSPEWMEDDTTIMSYKGHAHYFDDMVAEMDRMVGKVNEKLEELGIEDNTLIVFTGDNGTDVPIVSMLNGREVAGAKGESIDAGTRVPLIVKWPGVVTPGTVSNALIDFTDFLPTMCEAATIKIPDSLHIDGRSFMAQLQGEQSPHRQWIYSWHSRNGKESEATVFARNHRYKLYESGAFYEIPEDYKEQRPLDVEAMDADAKDVYQTLSDVLEHYKTRRLDKVPGHVAKNTND